jgi:hypothetical protein
MAGLKSAKERMRKIFRIGMAGFLGIFLVLAFFGHLQAEGKSVEINNKFPPP